MDSAKFPTEILCLILHFASGDFSTLLNLCAIDRRMYQLSAPLVHRCLALVSREAVSAFCTSSVDPNYITSLRIGPQYSYYYDSEIYFDPGLVRSALERVQNLKSLHLGVSYSSQIKIFKDDLVVQFNLDTFSYSGKASAPLLSFLEQQPSITRLGCYPFHDIFELGQAALGLRLYIGTNQQHLPNLAHFDGPPFLLFFLLPQRPISSITIQCYGHSPLKNLQPADSLVPVTQVCIVEDPHAVDRGTWLEIADILPDWEYPIEELKVLTRDTPKETLTNLISVYARILDCPNLKKLEIEIACHDQRGSSELSPSEIYDCLSNHCVAHALEVESRHTEVALTVFGYAVPKDVITDCLHGLMQNFRNPTSA